MTHQAIRFAVISEGTRSWPRYVSGVRGLFAQAGAGVDMTVTGSSVKALEQLIAGGYDTPSWRSPMRPNCRWSQHQASRRLPPQVFCKVLNRFESGAAARTHKEAYLHA